MGLNEPYVSSKDENTATTLTADLTTNYETNTSLAEKIKNVSSEQNFEGGWKSELDKKTWIVRLNI